MIAEYLSKKMINGKVPLSIKFIIKLMTLKRNHLSKKLGKFKYYENIEGNKEFYINKDTFDLSKRKNGISLFARLKNAQDFLKETVLSQEPFFDEIILVDNNSKDKTKEICKELEEKFPNKIKFYEYTPEVYPVGDERRSQVGNDSIHALSYYYNRTMSKTTCRYVAKLDDDIIVYDKENLNKIVNKIKTQGLNYLAIIPQLNINLVNGSFVTPISTPASKILPPIAGLYLDHGIFPISEYTYFVNDTICETLLFPFGTKIEKCAFFHLKALKKSKGVQNMKGEIAKTVNKNIIESKYIKLDKKLIDKNLEKIYESINNNNNL